MAMRGPATAPQRPPGRVIPRPLHFSNRMASNFDGATAFCPRLTAKCGVWGWPPGRAEHLRDKTSFLVPPPQSTVVIIVVQAPASALVS